MKIMIDISEKDYRRIKDIPDAFDSLTSRAYKSIKNGVPLPKGHGRLIDADKLHHCDCKGNFNECDVCVNDELCNLINDADTIIEADKEEYK